MPPHAPPQSQFRTDGRESGYHNQEKYTRDHMIHGLHDWDGNVLGVGAPVTDRSGDPGGPPLRRPTGGVGVKHGELNPHHFHELHDHLDGNEFEGGDADAARNGYEDVNEDGNQGQVDELDDGLDAETIEQNQRRVLRYFDTKWELPSEDPDWYNKVTAFIQKCVDPDAIEDLGLDLAGPDGKTFLFLIVTAAAPKLKQQTQASRRTFERRRDLFRWLMQKYPKLYKDGSDHMGYSVFEMAVKRAERASMNVNLRENDRLFIEFFMKNYPEQTSTLLNMDSAKTGTQGLALVHQLLSMVKGKQSLGPLALLHHLDQSTILQRDRNRNTVLHLAVAYKYLCDETEESQAQLLKGIKKILETCEQALRCTNKAGQSPYQYRVDTHNQMRLANATEKGLPLADDPIAQYLKDRYMHFEKRDDIIRYLHGDVQEYEIHVNLQELSGVNGALTRADLEGLIENLKLENILQCVQIPKYQLTTPQTKLPATRNKYNIKGTSATSAGRDQHGTGRRDYEQIFDLLWNKGVRKIIKIKVMDDEQNPHSDEVLEKLRRFDIEEWDWDRSDICSEILGRAAPNLRKVTLYSSGNNAVLRSWSGADGLNKLETLEEVNVIIYQRLESVDRVNAYMRAFLERMEENKSPNRNITVRAEVKTDSRSTGILRQATVDGEAKATQWLKTMDKFARFIANIPPEAQPEGNMGVKVALLDDGIDGLHGGFGRETLRDGISFLNHDDNVLPFCFSSIGHGTRMATLIRSMCPHVQLYIVRLHQKPSADGSQMQPTPESAALGIQWAIRKQVDIISMSWTIARTENNKEGMSQLENALQEARRANILMFGASSDQGWNEENPGLPSGFQGVFCIGAAKSSGKAEDLSEKEARYVLPGSSGSIDSRSSVVQKQGDSQGTQAEISANSSSFATALAAGLAALILYCVDLTGAVNAEDRKMLRKFEIMRDILDRMCSDNKKYIAVKKYFDPKLSSMCWDHNSEKRLKEIVEVIIRPFTDNRRKFVY